MNLREQEQSVESAEEWEDARHESPEVSEQVDVGPFLKVGTPATIQLEDSVQVGGGTRFSTTVRGWYEGRYIVMDYPASPRFARESRVNATYIVRFVFDGAVCAFLARLHDEYKVASLPFLRVDWPGSIKTLPMRDHERVDVRLDCDVKLGSGDVLHGVIQNVSTTGCNFLCAKPPIIKDLVHLTFTMQSGFEITDCPAVVRNRTPVNDQYSVGCQFRDPHSDLESVIELLVASRSPERRAGKSEKPQILIIEMGTGDCQSLRDALFMCGCDSFVARSALEGLSCVSDLSPRAILIGHAEGKSSENEVCSLLKDTYGMENTPVFVYNIREQELSKRGKQSGVLAYFNPDTPHDEISQFVYAAVSEENA